MFTLCHPFNPRIYYLDTEELAPGVNYSTEKEYGNIYKYEVREENVDGYYPRSDGMDLTNSLLNVQKPKEPGKEGETPTRKGGGGDVPKGGRTYEKHNTVTSAPKFQEMTDEELEDMLLEDLFEYNTPLAGFLLGTGDEVPAWVWGCGGGGVLALALALILGKRKKKKS